MSEIIKYPAMLYRDGVVGEDNIIVQSLEEEQARASDGYLPPGEAAPPKPDPGNDEKTVLMAKLDELGVQYDKRSGVAKLRGLLEEAKKGEG